MDWFAFRGGEKQGTMEETPFEDWSQTPQKERRGAESSIATGDRPILS